MARTVRNVSQSKLIRASPVSLIIVSSMFRIVPTGVRSDHSRQTPHIATATVVLKRLGCGVEVIGGITSSVALERIHASAEREFSVSSGNPRHRDRVGDDRGDRAAARHIFDGLYSQHAISPNTCSLNRYRVTAAAPRAERDNGEHFACEIYGRKLGLRRDTGE